MEHSFNTNEFRNFLEKIQNSVELNEAEKVILDNLKAFTNKNAKYINLLRTNDKQVISTLDLTDAMNVLECDTGLNEQERRYIADDIDWDAAEEMLASDSDEVLSYVVGEAKDRYYSEGKRLFD